MSNLEIFFTLCIPILLVGLGMGMKTKTPKKNRWIGWRTPAAMKNETIFKKANIYAGKIMFRYGICTLPVNAALSTMAQTVWVEILFWVRSMEDRLLWKLPAGKQSVPPICPVPKNPFCPNFPRTLKCR